MDKLRIAIFAALPQEIGPFKRSVPPWFLTGRRPFPRFRHLGQAMDLVLVETGMGRKAIADALRWELRRRTPHLVMSVGFAGSLSHDFQVGDVLLGNEWVEDYSGRPENALASACYGRVSLDPAAALIRFCREAQVRTARIVTVDRPEPKQALNARFASPPTLMDMESGAAAQLAMRVNIPFLCFRAVSDGLEDEIDFDVHALSDSSGKIRIPLVLAAVLRRPGLMASFARCSRRSARASQRLARVLSSLLSLPREELEAIIQSSRLLSS